MRPSASARWMSTPSDSSRGEGLQAGRAQGRSGLDDIGDGVGDAELDRDLDGPVQLHRRGVDAAGVKIVGDEVREARRDPGADELIGRGEGPDGAGVEEAGGAEAESEHFLGRRLRLQQQIASGDSGVEDARADVDGDIAGTQVEEFDSVDLVLMDQRLRSASSRVSGFAEHIGGGFGQCALVGHGYTQHGVPCEFDGVGSVSGSSDAQRWALTSSRLRPLAIIITCTW